jgi:hypothetical protein
MNETVWEVRSRDWIPALDRWSPWRIAHSGPEHEAREYFGHFTGYDGVPPHLMQFRLVKATLEVLG